MHINHMSAATKEATQHSAKHYICPDASRQVCTPTQQVMVAGRTKHVDVWYIMCVEDMVFS